MVDNEETGPRTAEERWMKQHFERKMYMKKLKKWLDEARLWHYNFSTRIPYNINNENVAHLNPQHNSPQLNNRNEQMRNGFQRLINNHPNNRNVPSFRYAYQFPEYIPRQPPSTYEFVIPPFWKRAVAEFMDFLLLLFVKIALTFVILESFSVIDMRMYGFDSFQKHFFNPDVSKPITVELLTLEIIHRIAVCIYETYFLRTKFCATPGKRYMGLMVITAESIAPGRLSETITATRATPLNCQKAFMRSGLKNLFLSFFLPLCFAFYVFPHNRMSYDMISNTIVVEYHPEFMVYN